MKDQIIVSGKCIFSNGGWSVFKRPLETIPQFIKYLDIVEIVNIRKELSK